VEGNALYLTDSTEAVEKNFNSCKDGEQFKDITFFLLPHKMVQLYIGIVTIIDA
jgi:hypothetical protein